MEVHRDVRSVGNRVAEVGLEYFCPDYVSKNGVSVMECNTNTVYPQRKVAELNHESYIKEPCAILGAFPLYCMVVALGGYGWYLELSGCCIVTV